MLVFTVLIAGMGGTGQCFSQQSDTAVSASPLQTSRKPSTAAATPPEGLTSVPEGLANVKLTPGMLLRFSVYDAPEMTSTLRVTDDGTVEVPLAGAVKVTGMSLVEARKKIGQALVAGQFFVSPEVNLDIAQLPSSYISVLGEVQNPGKFQAYGPLSLQAALALAGGETPDAGAEIDIQRAGAGPQVEHIGNEKRDVERNFAGVFVRPGDVVRVERAGIIYVLGAVHRPGGYLLVNRGHMDVLEALSVAGGTMLEAATDSIRIIHRTKNSITEQTVSLNKMTQVKADTPSLDDTDILYVPSSKAKSILVNGAVIIGAAASSLVYRVP